MRPLCLEFIVWVTHLLKNKNKKISVVREGCTGWAARRKAAGVPCAAWDANFIRAVWLWRLRPAAAGAHTAPELLCSVLTSASALAYWAHTDAGGFLLKHHHAVKTKRNKNLPQRAGNWNWQENNNHQGCCIESQCITKSLPLPPAQQYLMTI